MASNCARFTCSICYESYNETNKKPTFLIPCGHTFCYDCATKFAPCVDDLKTRCPNDKVEFVSLGTNWEILKEMSYDQDFGHVTFDLDNQLAYVSKSKVHDKVIGSTCRVYPYSQAVPALSNPARPRQTAVGVTVGKSVWIRLIAILNLLKGPVETERLLIQLEWLSKEWASFWESKSQFRLMIDFYITISDGIRSSFYWTSNIARLSFIRRHLWYDLWLGGKVEVYCGLEIKFFCCQATSTWITVRLMGYQLVYWLVTCGFIYVVYMILLILFIQSLVL